MANFWSNKPVAIVQEASKSTMRNIVNLDVLLKQIQSELDESKFNLDYKILELSDITNQLNILQFINDNYQGRKGDKLSLKYDLDLFRYFLSREYLAIGFYPKSKASMVGFIVGSKQKLCIRGESLNCIDVNFLCLVPVLRNMNVASYIINVLTKECILYFNKSVVCALYTVDRQLDIQNFSLKNYYHRPINLEHCFEIGFLPRVYDSEAFRKVYGTFSISTAFLKNRTIEYINHLCEKDEDLIRVVHQKVKEYDNSVYDIFLEKQYNQIHDLFCNKNFHNFVVKTNNGVVTDFVSFFDLSLEDKETKKLCRNGYFYTSFFEKDSHEHKGNVLEAVASLCLEKGILDSIVMLDTFGYNDKQYHQLKMLRGSGKLYFYLYNIGLYNIPPEKNGLITI